MAVSCSYCQFIPKTGVLTLIVGAGEKLVLFKN